LGIYTNLHLTGNKSAWRRGRLRKKMSCADEMPRRGAGLVQKLASKLTGT
jgi:hypothetical protein